jgi:hypothetical protein
MSCRYVLSALISLFTAVQLVSADRPVQAASTPAETAYRVDQLLAEELPSRPAVKHVDEVTYLRRVTLDLLGRNPTPDEITRFALDTAEGKRSAIVKKLLADDRYGVNWARYWRDVIMYRRTEERALLVARPLQEYLEGKFNSNAPWSEIATALITAKGDMKENGAVGLIVAQQGRPEETVSEISRIFLGVQIQCAQCHDHPTDRWKREQFHQLAAFFPRVSSRLKVKERTLIVATNDTPFGQRFNANNNRYVGSQEHYMPDLKDPSAKGTLMEPVFFATGEKLPTGTPDADRRGQLAAWVTQQSNPYFARALVNRLWSELCGEGFYEPVDDIGPDRDVTAPRTLEYLAGEFAAKDYNLKWLLKVITATDLYQRESRPRREPDEPAMTANVSQRLRADVVLDNLFAALDTDEPPATAVGMGAARQLRGPRAQFAAAFGYDPSERRDEISGSIPQALALMNSPMMGLAMSSVRRKAGLGKLLTEVKDDKELVTELYLNTLARQPESKELAVCVMHIRKAESRNEGAEDVQWSLVNSTEFLHRR